jgi:hypothetical protein
MTWNICFLLQRLVFPSPSSNGLWHLLGKCSRNLLCISIVLSNSLTTGSLPVFLYHYFWLQSTRRQKASAYGIVVLWVVYWSVILLFFLFGQYHCVDCYSKDWIWLSSIGESIMDRYRKSLPQSWTWEISYGSATNKSNIITLYRHTSCRLTHFKQVLPIFLVCRRQIGD